MTARHPGDERDVTPARHSDSERDVTPARPSGDEWDVTPARPSGEELDGRDGARGRRLAVLLAAVTALAVAAAGAWLWFGSAEPRPASFRGEPTSALYSVIASREADAEPLRLDEVFTSAGETLGTLRRVSAEQLADCGEALWGATVPGCTQALRATYRSGSGVAGQFVIFNLPDQSAADTLVAALAREGFVRQAVPFDPAHSRASARALGHYVTVSWVGASGPGADLVMPLIALDGLGRVVQSRVVAAT